jgi:L-seryl-tRNA(Ser) seleniumtransferase
MSGTSNQQYRRLPQVGEFVSRDQTRQLLEKYPEDLVTEASRRVIARLRRQLQQGAMSDEELEIAIEQLGDSVVAELARDRAQSLRSVINATGVILQTNLGRAPLSQAAIRKIEEVAGGYCNLEFDLASGERGRRGASVEKLILRLLTAKGTTAADAGDDPQSALVVNNCAAATYLALNTLAEGGEVIVSRGELVEIGGGFRIPDVLRKSGALLREVGTTNRTRITDYAAAITPATRLLLRVHRSNFRIEGFTERPSIQELIHLGERTSVPVFEDQGTGCAVHLAEYGIEDEAYWPDSASSGIDLVSSSGDKLLGGPQCGILVGKSTIIEMIRSNPLYRAFRVDKLTYAALEGTLSTYLDDDRTGIPVIRMLATQPEEVQRRCNIWADALRSGALHTEVVATRSMVGGGTTPGASLPSFAVALEHTSLTEAALAARLRKLDPPIVGRIRDRRVWLDLRTVPEHQDDLLIRQIRAEFSATLKADEQG